MAPALSTVDWTVYERAVESRARRLRWIRKGSFAVADQALISLSNFLISILLARWLSPEQYGSYALAFSIFLLLSLLYQSLLLEPMGVFGPSLYAEHQREYLGVLLRIHSGLVVVIVSVLGSAAWALHARARGDAVSWALAGLVLAAPCILLFWLARSAFYMKFAPQGAAVGALLYSALVVGGLVIIDRHGLISPFTSFLLMAVGAGAIAILQLTRLKPALKLHDGHPTLRDVCREHWIYGRWALASAVMIWIPSNIYYALLGTSYGMAHVGELKALLNLTLPMTQTATALSMLVQPYASRIRQSEGVVSVQRLNTKIIQFYGGAAVAYWVVLIPFMKPVVHHLYAGRYTGVTYLVPWIALSSVVSAAAHGPGVGLRSMRSSASIFVAFCASSVIALALGIPATWAFGLRGTISTMVLSNATALSVALFLLRRKIRDAVSN